MNTKQHWETVYGTKSPNEVSWTEAEPKSLAIFHALGLPKNASIIDIGGGDSNLVDALLAEGYTDITVLDISANSIKKAKKRLGDQAKQVTWVVSDINDFIPSIKYDIWHDRAAFHFLTEAPQIIKYKKMVTSHASHLIVATFSEKGPLKCSGLDIKQYSIADLEITFAENFSTIKAFNTNHTTPFNTVQNFSVGYFKNKFI